MSYLIGGPSTFTLTSDTLPEGKGFGLGDKATSQTGLDYRYVQAGSAITQYDTVQIDENFTALPITRALADDAGQVGFAQQAFASADYGWVAVSGGNITLRAASSASANAVLWTSDTAGVLTTAASTASHLPIFGVALATAATAGVTNVAAYAAFPVVRGVAAS